MKMSNVLPIWDIQVGICSLYYKLPSPTPTFSTADLHQIDLAFLCSRGDDIHLPEIKQSQPEIRRN